jgi:hypothetical protein
MVYMYYPSTIQGVIVDSVYDQKRVMCIWRSFRFYNSVQDPKIFRPLSQRPIHPDSFILGTVSLAAIESSDDNFITIVIITIAS